MAGEWPIIRLGDVVEINRDTIDRDWPYSHIHYIDISSVGEGLIQNPPQWMTLSDAPSRAKRLVRKGDTILSTVRPNRRSMFFASQPGDDWVVSTGFAVLRPHPVRIDPRYLYVCVFNRDFTEYLITREKGAAYPAVSPDDIVNAEIMLPPLKEQRAIAGILGALDDKIELNRRTNETLEAMARAIFKSWFVDFDPVRAKAEGRDPGLPAEIAGLFPDAFEESELGEIPAGWEVGSLLDIIDLLSGGTPSTAVPAYWNGEIPWVSAKDVGGAKGSFLLNTEKTISRQGVENSSTKMLPALTTIITARGTVGSYCLLGRTMAMNQTNYGLKAKNNVGDYFVFFSTMQLIEYLRQQAYGTIFDTITTKTFRDTMTVQPPEHVLKVFERVVEPVMQRVLSNEQQSRTLAGLRDTLLPKLLSGEIRAKAILA